MLIAEVNTGNTIIHVDETKKSTKIITLEQRIFGTRCASIEVPRRDFEKLELLTTITELERINQQLRRTSQKNNTGLTNPYSLESLERIIEAFNNITLPGQAQQIVKESVDYLTKIKEKVEKQPKKLILGPETYTITKTPEGLKIRVKPRIFSIGYTAYWFELKENSTDIVHGLNDLRRSLTLTNSRIRDYNEKLEHKLERITYRAITTNNYGCLTEKIKKEYEQTTKELITVYELQQILSENKHLTPYEKDFNLVMAKKILGKIEEQLIRRKETIISYLQAEKDLENITRQINAIYNNK